MNLKHIIQAWRDEEYRESLDAETRAHLPENPAGEIELTEFDLADANGGSTDNSVTLSNQTATATVTGPGDCDSWTATVTSIVRSPIQEA